MRTATLFVAIASAAASAAPLEVATGAHTVASGETYDWILASGDATLDMTGGDSTDGTTVMADGDSFNNIGAGALGSSVFTITGGVVAKRAFSFETGTMTIDGGEVNTAKAYGDSTYNLTSGTVNFGVYAHHDSVFTMTGGACEGNGHTRERALFVMTGGSIGGDFFSNKNSNVVIEAESFSYDHDNDDKTAPLPFDFARGSEIVITRDDPRFSDTTLNNIAHRIFYDFTVTFPGGASTTFDFYGYNQGNLTWGGSLTLRLAATDNPADLDGSGTVDSGDLAALLAAWGGPDADLNDDGVTDSSDLAILLAAWD